MTLICYLLISWRTRGLKSPQSALYKNIFISLCNKIPLCSKLNPFQGLFPHFQFLQNIQDSSLFCIFSHWHTPRWRSNGTAPAYKALEPNYLAPTVTLTVGRFMGGFHFPLTIPSCIYNSGVILAEWNCFSSFCSLSLLYNRGGGEVTQLKWHFTNGGLCQRVSSQSYICHV